MFKKHIAGPYTAAVVFAFLTGFSFLGIKECQNYGDQLDILTYRYNFAFLAAAAVWILGIFKSNIKDGSTKGKNRKMLFVAAFSYISFMVLQVIGIFYTTSVVGSIIFSITPIIAQIIASVVLKEKSNFKQNVFVVITVAALIYMILAGANRLEFSYTGVICLVMASIAMAVSNIAMRYIRADFTPFDISAVICVLGFLIFNCVSIAKAVIHGGIGEYFAPLSNPGFVVGTAYLGIGCLLFTSQLISYMLAKLPAINATIFGNVATAISIIAGVVILKEAFYTYHFICTVLIIIGVIGVSVCGTDGSGGKTSGVKTEKRSGA